MQIVHPPPVFAVLHAKHKMGKAERDQQNQQIPGQRVDVKGKFKATDEWHYFEIKTCSAKQSIREAFGQIMEYSHYDHLSTRATKLYIVGPEKPDEKDAAYIKKLRDMYHLPLWFRWYSFEDNKLHDEI